MEPTHLHLLTNHIPILGSLFAFILLIIGMVLKNRTVEVVSLSTLVVVVLFTIPAYLSGEEAEHIVEHMSMVNEHELEEHEEHAETTLWLMVLAGISALATLLSYNYFKGMTRWVRLTTVVICGVSFLSMIPLSLHGGKIMHTELRGDAQVNVSEDDHDDD